MSDLQKDLKSRRIVSGDDVKTGQKRVPSHGM